MKEVNIANSTIDLNSHWCKKKLRPLMEKIEEIIDKDKEK